MPIVDLSQTIHSRMPLFPGAVFPRVEELANVTDNGFALKLVTFDNHTGTHMDSPAHVLAEGMTLDSMEVSSFVGSALVADFTHVAQGLVGLEDLLPLEEKIERNDFFLFHTGWSRFWGEDKYFEKFPLLTQEACGWIATKGIKGFGMDVISVDPVDAEDLVNHRLLLDSGMVLVENLTNLQKLPEEGASFYCLPLKVEGSDGFPARAIAVF